jgi:hypothetical protein
MHVLSGLPGLRIPVILAGVAAFLIGSASSHAQAPKTDPKQPEAQLPVGNLDTKDWLKYSTKPLEKGEIDRLVLAELAKVNIKPAPVTTDEQFVRRAYLDLTGKLPTPQVIVEFLKDKSTNKRAKLIDTLLDSDDYAKHWSHYWRTVVTTRATLDFRTQQIVPHYERWLNEQFKANKSWDSITRDILTATGKVMYAERDTNGQAFFLLSRRGADAVTEIAAETSRIFLGIQIQCAQCHDHPSDVWKREQFHEFAAYFGRYRGERPIIEDKNKFVGSQLVSLPFAEHRMTDKEDPKKGVNMTPKFLDGKSPAGAKVAQGGGGGFGGKFGGKGFQPKGKGGAFGSGGGLNDEARRKALADQITSKDNPWFAAAFVNRMWGEFMGQSFYSPIDDLGPQKDAMMPTVLARVSASFRGNGYDIKQVIRDIMNSDTYQRQIRPGESGDEHQLFATHNPVRMNGNALWQSLTGTLGPIGGFGGFGGKGGFMGKGGFGGLEQQFKNEFSYDPSTKAEEIEGSIAQALILMNNPQINQKIKASPNNVLGRILASNSDNDEALRVVYLRTLARRPTDREMTRLREHIGSVKNRAEAFEDILWALVNSTEFQMKR